MNWKRGSGSEEPSPIAKRTASFADSVVDPGTHREAGAPVPAPRRRNRWTDAGFELRGALTVAASPTDEREFAPHEHNLRGSRHRCCHRWKSRHLPREVTFEEAPGSMSRCVALSSHARNRHRSGRAAGAGLPNADQAVAGFDHVQRAIPPQGLALQRSLVVRSDEQQMRCLVSRRVSR